MIWNQKQAFADPYSNSKETCLSRGHTIWLQIREKHINNGKLARHCPSYVFSHTYLNKSPEKRCSNSDLYLKLCLNRRHRDSTVTHANSTWQVHLRSQVVKTLISKSPKRVKANFQNTPYQFFRATHNEGDVYFSSSFFQLEIVRYHHRLRWSNDDTSKT